MDATSTSPSETVESKAGGQGSGLEPRAHESFPLDLLRSLKHGRGVLFVGPGVSRQAGLDLRQELHCAILAALRQNIQVQEADELEQFLERATPAEAAQALQDQIGREAFLHFLKTHIRLRDVPPPPLVYALRSLPFKLVVTTNFDHLLERSYLHPLTGTVDAEVFIPTVAEHVLPEDATLTVVVKLFGDVERPDTLVLTTDDYETFFRARPALLARLRTEIELGPAVFVGYQLHDPEFRRLYSQVGAITAKAHKRAYAVLEQASRFETHWWSHRALFTLTPQGRGGVDAVIRELNRQLQVLLHPGEEFEPEAPSHPVRKRPVGPWNLAPLIQSQAALMAKRWLISGTSAPLDLRTGYIHQSLLPEGGPGNEREARLTSLLSESKQEVLAELRFPRSIEALTALDESSRVLVHGPAGAGKTTLLLYLLAMRSESLADSGERTLVVYLPAVTVAERAEMDFVGLISAYLSEVATGETAEDIVYTVNDALKDGRLLLLLDGLDEISLDAEAGVLSRLEAFLKDVPKAAVVMTVRSSALEPSRLPTSLAFRIVELAPLSPEQQASLIRERLRGKPVVAQYLTSMLRTGLVPWAERLASNPLHLALMCLTFQEENLVPFTRAEMYAALVNILLLRSPAGVDNTCWAFEKEKVLTEAAFSELAHPELSLSRAALIALTKELLRSSPDMDLEVAERVVRELLDHSGLLVAAGMGDTVRFRVAGHREYFAARKLMTLPMTEVSALVNQHAAERRFAGVWRLYSAIAPDATPLLTALSEAEGVAPRLLIRCFGDATSVDLDWVMRQLEARGDTFKGELLLRLRHQLPLEARVTLSLRILEQDRERVERSGERTDSRALFVAISCLDGVVRRGLSWAVEAEEALALWRAPESIVERVVTADVVSIPAGPFLMGNPDSGICRYINLPAYDLGRHPVTVRDYRFYAPHYSLPGIPNSESFDQSDHPVVDVSFFDAWVCSRYLCARLPTEAEWEKAACWDSPRHSRRLYPWGNEWHSDRCNSLEVWRDGLGHTTPVTRYGVAGASAFGCEDMAGNVLEWTSDRGNTRLDRRVLKGGSWQSSQVGVQPLNSVWLRPFYRGLGAGFRLARSQRGGQAAAETPATLEEVAEE